MYLNITLAAEAGFCFGVKRAIQTVEQLVDEGKKVCTLGPIIHNPQEVERLASLGVISIDRLEDAPPGYYVVIRSHGVPKEIYKTLEETGTSYCDTTCPYVQKIHKLAAKHSQQGKTVLVAGDKNHPEVLGILSHAGENAQCFSSTKELQQLVEKNPPDTATPYIMVAQTTFNYEEWVNCTALAKESYTNLEIFDTICNATMLRQKAAEDLAIESDYMVVVGGKNSSNTAKLAQICSDFCPTVHIERPEELHEVNFGTAHNIGVTAGASTPAFIIKEVQNIMSDKVNNDEMSFEEMLDESFKTISARDRVTGVVTSVSQNEIAVDIGTKHAGYVPSYEYTDDPNADLEELVHVNDEIELIVLRVNDAEGTALLSKKRLDAIAGFEVIQEAEESDEALTGTVIEVVKGGLIVLSNHVRVFIPASHATIPRGQDLNDMLGDEVQFKLLETNPNRRRAVGSIREVLLEERKVLADEFWDEAKVGDIRKGVVKSLTSYGAFIDLGGVDGMAHISELSWTRIKHPSDVVSIGEEVEVLIKDLDPEERKISLSYKKEEENPWNILERDYRPGMVVKVKIVSMTTFGAFAEVIPGVDGLIHISQISHERIEKPSDVLAIGQEVEVVITDIDFERERVSLSIRALLDEEERIAREEASTSPEVVGEFGPEEDAEDVEETEEAEEVVEVEEKPLKEKIKDKVDEVEDKVDEIEDKIEDKVDEIEDEIEEKIEEVKEKIEKKKEAKKAEEDADEDEADDEDDEDDEEDDE